LGTLGLNIQGFIKAKCSPLHFGDGLVGPAYKQTAILNLSKTLRDPARRELWEGLFHGPFDLGVVTYRIRFTGGNSHLDLTKVIWVAEVFAGGVFVVVVAGESLPGGVIKLGGHWLKWTKRRRV
jgi:hypothetical protein